MAAGTAQAATGPSFPPRPRNAAFPVRRHEYARITLITIDLSFHAASAAVVARLLEKHGVAVDELRAPHERAFALLAAGQGDMLCSAWLPGSHGGYLAPLRTTWRSWPRSTNLTRCGRAGLRAGGAVAEIADLKKPEVASRMIKRIQGINPGAGISRFSREIIARYRLDEAGYHFENGSLEDCAQAFEQAVARGDWVVAPLWQPQFLYWRHRIRALADPENLLRGRDEATLIAARTRWPACRPQPSTTCAGCGWQPGRRLAGPSDLPPGRDAGSGGAAMAVLGGRRGRPGRRRQPCSARRHSHDHTSTSRHMDKIQRAYGIHSLAPSRRAVAREEIGEGRGPADGRAAFLHIQEHAVYSRSNPPPARRARGGDGHPLRAWRRLALLALVLARPAARSARLQAAALPDAAKRGYAETPLAATTASDERAGPPAPASGW
ncbi:ABC-type proline/glycine betaine transport systems, periplasmic components [Chromobacterium violaceum]|uniref:ABC-type proline/glycine betaine transport systems, periplasmic components n=1 Tax=Chromobacterium violaceum TaxID=536 RepID=A0A447TAH6_CHRVL|nr:ABC-type proline/glycine betaine transport systems, periplasmic components [Chromobacterium violaceum]